MSNKKPPFRADQVGSLLRPGKVLKAWSEREAGEMSPDDVRRIENEAIADLVKLQEEVGLNAITDGECRRRFFHTDFLEQVGGVEVNYEGTPKKFRAPDGTEHSFSPPKMMVVGKLEHDKDIMLADFEYVKSTTDKMPKVTIPSPSMVHFRGGREAIDEKAYPELGEFFQDLAAVYRAEVASLANAGLRYLQLDDTNLAYLCDPEMRETARHIGEDPDKLPELYANLVNESIKGRPDDMVVGIHLCRGNFKSMGVASGGYEPVAEVLFNDMNVDSYFLEYDDERSGDFEPLRFMPKGKTAVLGVVSSKTGELENKDMLKRRIDDAAKYMPLEQIAISPQCGFASTHDGNSITVEQEKAKLRLCVELAEEIWGTAA
ncbi:MAG TPA: 5-methyltetrahydropteroyltriglutamate--homocysteine S-methyltransferase [Alphaproteobacteria bacterium]|nr:5-methyltetrahydropteroyltriglutamate--homocysteine S-methyltransferase [Alphaproteobacteria bacterium]